MDSIVIAVSLSCIKEAHNHHAYSSFNFKKPLPVATFTGLVSKNDTAMYLEKVLRNNWILKAHF